MLKSRRSKYSFAFLSLLAFSFIIAATGSAAISPYGEIETTPKQQYNYVPKNVSYTDNIYTLEYTYQVTGISGAN
jgi:hypothetical protein